MTELVDIPAGSDATNLTEPGCSQSPFPLNKPVSTTALFYGSPFMGCCFLRCDLKIENNHMRLISFGLELQGGLRWLGPVFHV